MTKIEQTAGGANGVQVYELLEGQQFCSGEHVNIIWPDFFKESHPVHLIQRHDRSGVIILKAAFKIFHHGTTIDVFLTDLIERGAEITRRSV